MKLSAKILFSIVICISLSQQLKAQTVTTFVSSGLSNPFALAFDGSGNLYVTNSVANNIAKITSGGVVSGFVSSGLNFPTGLIFDLAGNLYVCNDGLNNIKKVTSGGVVSTFATGVTNPQNITIDAANNFLYVANSGDNTISKISLPGGVVTTFATGLNSPYPITIDGSGNLYVGNTDDGTISKITSGGVVSTFASGVINPLGLAFDGSGNLYASSVGDIKKITSGGVVSTFVTGLNNPCGMVYDGIGSLYVAELTNSDIKKVTIGPGIAATGTLSGFSACAGSASTAQSFTVAGGNLTSGISITPPVGFEVSTSSSFASSVGTNASPLVLTQSGGSVSTTTVYARLTSSATGTPSGNIACSSTGATTQNVAVSGTVNTTAISSFTPSSGVVGSLVTITGTGLSNPTALSIGGVAAIVITNTGTQLVAMVMPGAATGTVSITTACGSSSGAGNFSVGTPLPPTTQQGNKLVASDNTGNALQGTSVALSADGNTAIVGGYQDNSGVGAAWIYTRSGGVWTQQGAKLVGTGSIGNANQGNGVSLSADGNTALIGGAGDNSSVGAVWVFTRTAGVWSQQGSKLTVSDNIGTAGVGRKVSLSADGNIQH